MEKTIKEKVKEIFATHTFEEALELTRYLRGDYIGEYGPKSWNGLVTYYKKANFQPESIQVAEPETIYPESSTEENKEVFGAQHGSSETTNVGDAQIEVTSSIESSEEVEILGEEERVEYMLYQNDGEKVDWYGHFVNYKGLKVGDSGMMVRMNNLGVGKGMVLATASMTMEEIGMFHKCYATIRQSTLSDNKRVELFTKAFNNLQSAMRDPKFATLSKSKDIANFVLNYKKED